MHSLEKPGELDRLVQALAPKDSQGTSPSMAAFLLHRIAVHGSIESAGGIDRVLAAGAIAGLVSLLGSPVGREAEYGAGAMWDILCWATAVQEEDAIEAAVIDAGAVPALVRLLGSCLGVGASWQAAGALWVLLDSSDASRGAVMEAGGLQKLVRLLWSRQGSLAERTALAIESVLLDGAE